MSSTYDYAFYKKSADYIRSRIGGDVPRIGIVLGSCLGSLDESITDRIEIPYADIPNYLTSSAPGHAGKLICGSLGGARVLCMSGRFHYYEGYSFDQLRIPVYVFRLLGVETLILTNAAGAVNLDYEVGDICVLKDHINLCGATPQRGENLPEFGPRFFSMSNAYTPGLRTLAKEAAVSLGFSLREGTYFYAPGPHFETPAEIRAMRLLGADMVGMSTVTEVLSAAHCGMDVLALSLATNLSADRVLDHDVTEDVANVADVVQTRFRALLLEILRRLCAGKEETL